MVDYRTLVRELLTARIDLFLATLVVLLGVVLSVLAWRLVKRLLTWMGLADAVEGTPFERSTQRLGTSTVALLSQLAALFVFGLSLVVALQILGVITGNLFVVRLTAWLPQLFVAVVVIILGLIAGERAALVVSERLRGVKVSGVDALPDAVKYTVFFVAAVVALDQMGIAVAALLAILLVGGLGVVVVTAVAFRHQMSSFAAGIYLLLTEPYAIGDEIEIDGKRGIVQEVDVFVTRIEAEGEEYVVPNRQVFREGIVRVRE